jgi:hypothetical protein
VTAPPVWNSYAGFFISIAGSGAQHAGTEFHGADMNEPSRKGDARPYSTLGCILLLLATGIAVKTAGAIHLCQVAQGACPFALN